MRKSVKKYHFVLYLLLITAGLLAAGCNMPRATPTDDSVATNAAQTVAAELTESAQEGPEPSQTPPSAASTEDALSTATSEPASATPEPTSCTDEATFVTDVTVPDDTNFSPEETFTKTWRLRNSGTCTWTTDYDLIFDSGRAMGGPPSQPLPGRVAPNSTVDVSVELSAPSTEGSHRGNWKLRNADGVSFGIGSDADSPFWVQISVGPTPTPAPVIYNNQKGDLEPDSYVDLDEGDFSPSNAARDLFYNSVSNTENYLEPQNGALIELWGPGAPSFEQCQGADLANTDISFEDISIGDWICFETSEGRIGRFEVEALAGGPPPDMTIDIRTWE